MARALAALALLQAAAANATAKQQCAFGTPNNGCPKGQHCWSGSCRCDCAAGPKAPCTMPPCAAPTPSGGAPKPTGKTVEIAPGVAMPSVSLGTCCGSDPKCPPPLLAPPPPSRGCPSAPSGSPAAAAD